MKIYFIRHGETHQNKSGLITGQLDIPLNEEGIQQIYDATNKIPDDFTLIYSSDFIRCKQTTDILNKKLHATVVYDARLRERSFGTLEGTPIDNMDQKLRELDRNQEYDYRPYGGECVDQVKHRFFAWLENVKTNHSQDKILVVTSGGIIRLLYRMMNEETYSKILNGSIHEFEF